LAGIPYGAGCVTIDGGLGLAFSYEWAGVILDAGCSATSGSAGDASLVQPKTICCR
jgi:hypothetical protein